MDRDSTSASSHRSRPAWVTVGWWGPVSCNASTARMVVHDISTRNLWTIIRLKMYVFHLELLYVILTECYRTPIFWPSRLRNDEHSHVPPSFVVVEFDQERPRRPADQLCVPARWLTACVRDPLCAAAVRIMYIEDICSAFVVCPHILFGP